MALLPRFLSNLAGTARDFFVGGDLRLRKGYTGGGEIFARNFEAGDNGFFRGIDTSGSVVYAHGADGTADYWALSHGASVIGGGDDDINVDLATGEVTMPAFRLKNLSADPTTPTPTAGRKYWNTTTSKERTFDGTVWNDAGASVSLHRKRNDLTAVGGETVISTTQDIYEDSLNVYVDGVLKPLSDVTMTGVRVATFATPATTGQIFAVDYQTTAASPGDSVFLTTLTLTGMFPDGSPGAYSADIAIAGGDGTYTLTGGTGVSAGSLPAGLSLSIVTIGSTKKLRLSGSATTISFNTFTVSVDSGDGQTTTSPQSVTVEAWYSAFFAGGEAGIFYDVNNLPTLWQHTNRTTAVTTVGDHVAYFDDLSGNVNNGVIPANQPAIAFDATAGKYYLDMTGAAGGDSLSYPASLQGDPDFTMAYRSQAAVTVFRGAVLEIGNGGSDYSHVLFSHSDNLTRVNVTDASQSAAAFDGANAVWVIVKSGHVVTVYKNGTSYLTISSATTLAIPSGSTSSISFAYSKRFSQNFADSRCYNFFLMDRAATGPEVATLTANL